MSDAEFRRQIAETVITHDDAQKIALRLIAGAFNNPDNRPRFTIPTRPDDDDVLMMEYIRRQKTTFDLTEDMEAAFFRAKDEYELMKADRVFPRPTLAAHVWDAMVRAKIGLAKPD